MKTDMKKLVATACFTLLGAGAFAQTSQGTITVSGSVNFRNETFNNQNVSNDQRTIYRNISLQPSVGYFVKDGLELGVGVGFSQYSSKLKQEAGNITTKNNNLHLRFYAQQYVALTEQLMLHGTGFATVGLGYGKYKGVDDTSSELTGTTNDFGAGIYPGLTYFATPKLGLTATFGSLSFFRTKYKPKDSQQSDRTTNSFHANLSPSSVSFGLGYFITR